MNKMQTFSIHLTSSNAVRYPLYNRFVSDGFAVSSVGISGISDLTDCWVTDLIDDLLVFIIEFLFCFCNISLSNDKYDNRSCQMNSHVSNMRRTPKPRPIDIKINSIFNSLLTNGKQGPWGEYFILNVSSNLIIWSFFKCKSGQKWKNGVCSNHW